MPLAGAKLVTEIEALKVLVGVQAFHAGSGGCGSSQGAVFLVSEREADAVERAIHLVESIKGEPPLAPFPETNRNNIHFYNQCLVRKNGQSPASILHFHASVLPRAGSFLPFAIIGIFWYLI